MLIKKLLLVISGMLMAVPAFSRDFKYTHEGQTVKYTVIDENAKTCMTKEGTQTSPGNMISGALVIPEVAKSGKNEYTVVKIGFNSFGDNPNLTSVVMPNTVQVISNYAFDGCGNLRSLAISGSASAIGKGAFNCSNLEELTIGDGDTPIELNGNMFDIFCSIRKAYIGRNWIFKSEGSKKTIFNDALCEATIGNRVTEIPDYAFYECKSLASVTLSDSLKTIGEHAFYGCSKLTSLVLPPSLNTIKGFAFTDCDMLASVEFPASLTTIGEHAFKECKSLKTVNLPNALHSIGEYAFCGCTDLQSVALSDSLASIGSSAFANCTSLKSIKLPDTLKDIQYQAFCRTGLTSVTLPASLEFIGRSAFYGSPIQEVTMPDNFLQSLESKKNVFAGTPYFDNIQKGIDGKESAKLKNAVAGTWRMVNWGRNEGTITFYANGTYVCNFQKSKISDFYFTFTEKGTWEFYTTYGKSYVKLKITSVGPSAVITPCPTASAYQKKLPGVFAQMTSGEKSEFLKEYAKNREFRMLSAKEMQNSTYGYDIEKNFKLVK